jgi:hypothetical protein
MRRRSRPHSLEEAQTILAQMESSRDAAMQSPSRSAGFPNGRRRFGEMDRLKAEGQAVRDKMENDGDC